MEREKKSRQRSPLLNSCTRLFHIVKISFYHLLKQESIDNNKFSAPYLKVILSLLFVLCAAVHANISVQSIGQVVIRLRQDA